MATVRGPLFRAAGWLLFWWVRMGSFMPYGDEVRAGTNFSLLAAHHSALTSSVIRSASSSVRPLQLGFDLFRSHAFAPPHIADALRRCAFPPRGVMLQANKVRMNFLQVAPAQASELLLQFKDTHSATLIPRPGTAKLAGCAT